MNQTPPQAGDGEPPVPDGGAMNPIDEWMQARLTRLERLLGVRGDEARLPAWLRRTEGESRWPVGLAILVAVALQLALPIEMLFQPNWLLPAIELALFTVLMIASPVRINRESTLLRGVSITLVLVATWALTWSAARLVYGVVEGRTTADARTLLLTGGAIWLTNVIVFALWYWEIDRGGPAARANARQRHPDFLFSQMMVPEIVHDDWEPYFIDYLYLSFTNATAFSPTDTLPLSRWAKLTMMFQSAGSLATVVLVVARAVNILR